MAGGRLREQTASSRVGFIELLGKLRFTTGFGLPPRLFMLRGTMGQGAGAARTVYFNGKGQHESGLVSNQKILSTFTRSHEHIAATHDESVLIKPAGSDDKT